MLGQNLRKCATEDAVEITSDAIDALIDVGWREQDIALLTTCRQHEE